MEKQEETKQSDMVSSNNVANDCVVSSAVALLAQHRASNIEGGVVIDLRGLNSVAVSADQTDRRLAYTSPQHGFTCGTVTNFEVALADASVVNASHANDPDLFSALKGGGKNFGVVARIDLKTFKQGRVWTGSVCNDFSVVDEVIREPEAFAVTSNRLAFLKMGATTPPPPPSYEGLLALPSLRKTSQLLDTTSLAKSHAGIAAGGIPVRARPGPRRQLRGTRSLRRLQEVRRRVDPLGLFTYQLPGGYKLPGDL
ncbi:hypothetical protein F4780DRAFT_783583 [Xylariomycetidae sp. FL0641]|nr:hypothetical protein F4780DRAFT_783583 [Xylariomycetidae sp. FL0641]